MAKSKRLWFSISARRNKNIPVDEYSVLEKNAEGELIGGSDNEPEEPEEPEIQKTVVLQQGFNNYTGTTDAHLYDYHHGVNYGERELMNNSRRNDILIRFAIYQSEGGPVPDGATINSATLSLYKTSAYNYTYELGQLGKNWVESEVTWEEARAGVPWSSPGAGLNSSRGGDYFIDRTLQSSVPWEPSWLRFDVKASVSTMPRLPNYGWKLVQISGNDNYKKFASSEYSVDPTLRPILEINYTN